MCLKENFNFIRFDITINLSASSKLMSHLPLFMISFALIWIKFDNIWTVSVNFCSI